MLHTSPEHFEIGQAQQDEQTGNTAIVAFSTPVTAAVLVRAFTTDKLVELPTGEQVLVAQLEWKIVRLKLGRGSPRDEFAGPKVSRRKSYTIGNS